MEKLTSIRKLLASEWNSMIHMSVSKEQIHSLMHNAHLSFLTYTFPPTTSFEKHTHQESRVILVTKGNLTHVRLKQSQIIRPGELIIIPAKQVHSAYTVKGCTMISFQKKISRKDIE